MSEFAPKLKSLKDFVAGGFACDGDWIESKDQDPSGEVRLIQLADIGEGIFLNKSNRFLNKVTADRLNCTYLKPGDLLISRLGEPLGKCCIFPDLGRLCVTAVDVHIVRFPEGEGCPRFAMNMLNSPQARHAIEAHSSGTTRKRITGKKLQLTQVPELEYGEQKLLADKIDELFSRIDEGERALKTVETLIERYRQSVLKAAVTGELTRDWREAHQHEFGKTIETGEQLLARILKARREAWEKAELEKMIAKGKPPKSEVWKLKYKEPAIDVPEGLPELPDGWVWASLRQLGEVMGGLTKNAKRGELPEKRPFLRVANVYSNELRLGDIHEIGVKDSELARVELMKGDLLVVEGNGSPDQIGRVAKWDGSIEGCVHQNHLIKVRFREEWLVDVCLQWCMSPHGRAEIRKVASSTSGLYTLSLSKVEQLFVPLMPEQEASLILGQLEVARTSISNAEFTISSHKKSESALRQSILKAAFEGRLTQSTR